MRCVRNRCMMKQPRTDGFITCPITTAHGQHPQSEITTVQPAAGSTESGVGLGKSLNPVPCKSWHHTMSLIDWFLTPHRSTLTRLLPQVWQATKAMSSGMETWMKQWSGHSIQPTLKDISRCLCICDGSQGLNFSSLLQAFSCWRGSHQCSLRTYGGYTGSPSW